MNDRLRDCIPDNEQTRELLQIIEDIKANKQEAPKESEEALEAMNKAASALWSPEQAVLRLAGLCGMLDVKKCGMPGVVMHPKYRDLGKLFLDEGITHDVLARAYEIYDQRHKGENKNV